MTGAPRGVAYLQASDPRQLSRGSTAERDTIVPADPITDTNPEARLRN